eukprot:scaffold94602_cov63-Phaeocystis_antarctica.AAC.3
MKGRNQGSETRRCSVASPSAIRTVQRATARQKGERPPAARRAGLDVASASCTAAFAAALAGIPKRESPYSSRAGSAPLSSAAARAAQPASVIWAFRRLSTLSFFSPPVAVDSAPAGSGATRAARPSSPNRLFQRLRCSSAGSRRKAGARATRPASPMAALLRLRNMSSGMAPRPRAAASAETPASPTCMLMRDSRVTEGSAFAPSPSNSRCPPSGGPAAPAESWRARSSSAGSTEASVPSNARSAVERPLRSQSTFFASRSSLQLRSPTLRHNAAATSWSALSCCSSACVSARSSLLVLLNATATRASSTLHSWLKMMHCSSPLSFDSAIRGARAVGGLTTTGHSTQPTQGADRTWYGTGQAAVGEHGT